MVRIALQLIALTFALPASAQVYRCSLSGSVTYTDSKCDGGVEVDVNPSINSFPAPRARMSVIRGVGGSIRAPMPNTLSPSVRNEPRQPTMENEVHVYIHRGVR